MDGTDPSDYNGDKNSYNRGHYFRSFINDFNSRT